MEIELPDGTVLDAPDGSDPKQVVRGYHISKLKAENPGEYDPESSEFKKKYGATAGMGTLSKLAAGYDRGIVGIGKRVTNLVLPDSITPEWASDKGIKEHNKLMSDLDETGAGKVGRFVGETAVTLPLSMGAGAAVQAGGKALSALPNAVRAARVAGQVAASPATRAAVEGAVSGLAGADPGERAKGAAFGAGTSLAMHGAGKVLSRAMQGLVRKSPAAKFLEEQADIHRRNLELPLSEAADDTGGSGLVKQAYRKVLPYVPGATSRLQKQSDEAGARVRELIMDEVTPMGPPGNATKFQVPEGAGEYTRKAMRGLKDAVNETYDDTVKQYKFNIPDDAGEQVEKSVRSAFKGRRASTEIDDVSMGKVRSSVEQIFSRFSNGSNEIDGTNLLLAKKALQDEAKHASVLSEKQALWKASEWVDSHINSELTQGNKLGNINDLVRWQQTNKAYNNFPKVASATLKSVENHGNFTPKQLLKSLGKRANDDEAITKVAQAAQDTIGQGWGRASPEGRVATYAGLGALLHFGGPWAAAAALGGGHTLASKSTQNFLLGNQNWQKLAANYIRQHPGTTLRQAVRILASKEVADSQKEEDHED